VGEENIVIILEVEDRIELFPLSCVEKIQNTSEMVIHASELKTLRIQLAD